MRPVLVALAGATGAVVRYGVGIALGVRSFPWATLGINIVGSFALGFLLALGTEKAWSEAVTVPLAVGFLGAFTTFSTFSHETFILLRTGRSGMAALYVAMSVVGGVVAAAGGYAAARAIA